MTNNSPRLCQADEKTFWPWRSWTDFAGLPDKKNFCVVVPVCGFADWGAGLPLDAEEVVLMPVLAAAASRPDAAQIIVTPPLRFVAGADAGCAFVLDVPTAHAFIEEVCVSIAAAGFSRIVLFNSSPWNEDLLDAAARDLRIERGLQMFCINLSALELDFHPVRGRSREDLHSLVAGLANPAEPSASAAAILSRASGRLAGLLREIIARPPLPRDGALANLTAP